jgi:hypothetical protein
MEKTSIGKIIKKYNSLINFVLNIVTQFAIRFGTRYEFGYAVRNS